MSTTRVFLNRVATLLFFVAITVATILVVQEMSNRRRCAGWCYISNENLANKKLTNSDSALDVSNAKTDPDLKTTLAESLSSISNTVLITVPSRSDSLLDVSDAIDPVADQKHAQTNTENHGTDTEFKNTAAEKLLVISEMMRNLDKKKINISNTPALDILEQTLTSDLILGVSDVMGSVDQQHTQKPDTKDRETGDDFNGTQTPTPKPGESNSTAELQDTVSVDEKRELAIDCGDETLQPTSPVEILLDGVFHVTHTDEQEQTHAAELNLNTNESNHLGTLNADSEPDSHEHSTTQTEPALEVVTNRDPSNQDPFDRKSADTLTNTLDSSDVTSSKPEDIPEPSIEQTHTIELNLNIDESSHSNILNADSEPDSHEHSTTQTEPALEVVTNRDPSNQDPFDRKSADTLTNTLDSSDVTSSKPEDIPEPSIEQTHTIELNLNIDESSHSNILNADSEPNSHEHSTTTKTEPALEVVTNRDPSNWESVDSKSTDALTDTLHSSDIASSELEDIKQKLADLTYIVATLRRVP